MNDTSGTVGSFSAYNGALGIVGPTAEEDISRAIDRYGVDAVKRALKKLTRRRAGRPKIDDFAELRPIFERDARVWLKGGDPFSDQSNYAIAKAQSDGLKEHQAPSKIDRVERKLRSEPFGRKWFTVTTAYRISFSEFPFAQHIRALTELTIIDPEWIWDQHLRDAVWFLSAYEKKMGMRPPQELSMQLVQDAVGVATGALSAATKGQSVATRNPE